VRVALVRLVCRVVVRCLFRVRVEGRANLPPGPVILCANHLNWADPLVLIALLPRDRRYAMLGPAEADMRRGARNRLIAWAGFAVPFHPGRTDLLGVTRRVERVLGDGWTLVTFGEGRIHRGERELLPLAPGTAFFAFRAGVPIVPVALNGTSSLGLGRRIRLQVGEPIAGDGRPTRDGVARLTALTAERLRALVADFPDPPPPGPFGRWLTELFNEWPADAARGPGDGEATEPAGGIA